MRHADKIERSAEEFADQGAQEQGGEKQAAAEAGGDRGRGGTGLHKHEQPKPPHRKRRVDHHSDRAVAGRQYHRRGERQYTDGRTANGRTQPARYAAPAEPALEQGHPTHDGDANQGTQHAHRENRHVVLRQQPRRRQCQLERRGPQSMKYRHRDHGRHCDRSEGADGISTDDQLEGVKRPGQRPVESGTDCGRGAATHHQTLFTAAQVKRTPYARSEACPHLGITGLQSNRGANTIGQDRLQHHRDVVAHRYATAVERIGLDRVDRRARPDALECEREKPNGQAPDQRYPQRPEWCHVRRGGKMLVHIDAKQHYLQKLRRHRHQVDDQAANSPNKGGQHKQPDLVGADQCTHDLRRVQHCRPG